MDKRLVGLLGAVSALVLIDGAAAAPAAQTVVPATSFSDLLQPIPNAVALLAVHNDELANKGADIKGDVQVADHHHHHHHYRRRHHHHHHHHMG